MTMPNGIKAAIRTVAGRLFALCPFCSSFRAAQNI